MILSVVHLCVLMTIGFWIYARQAQPMRRFYWPALIVKCIAGVGLGLLYYYYYDGDDTFVYHTDAMNLGAFASRDPAAYINFLWSGNEAPDGVVLQGTVPRAMFFAKFTSIAWLVTGGNYWVVGLYFSVISFLSSWHLTNVIHQRLKLTTAPVIALLFIPSVVFWTSGLIKESIAMAAMYFLTVILLKLYTDARPRLWEWVLLPFALWILWNLKYYFVAVFLPVGSTLLVMRMLIMRHWPIRNRVLYFIIWSTIFTLPLFVATLVHPNFYPERFLDVIVENHDAFIALSDKGDFIQFSGLTSAPKSIILNMPAAVVSALFRPFPWEATNMVQLGAALENLVISILTAWALYSFAIRTRKEGLCMSALAAGTLLFVFLLASFLALSTPNFGTLSRYRVGFLPYYLLIIISAIPALLKFDRRL